MRTFQDIFQDIQHNVFQGPQRDPNERADTLAGKAAEKTSWSQVTSLAHPYTPASLKGSGKLRMHGTTIQPTMALSKYLRQKSCLDKARDALARTAAQIRAGHRRSTEHLKRIRKQLDDNC